MKNIQTFEEFLNEGAPNNYIHIIKNLTVKTIKGKSIKLKDGDRGVHRGGDFGPDYFIINGDTFDAEQFDNDDYDVS